MSTDKNLNYSKEQCDAIRAAEPLNLESAKALGKTLGKSYRSIIAKCASMKVKYIPQPTPTKRVAKETKAELVAKISNALSGTDLVGLEKSTSRSLVALLDAVSE